MNNPGETKDHIHEQGNIHRAFLKGKICSDILVPRQFTFKFSLCNVKVDLIV